MVHASTPVTSAAAAAAATATATAIPAARYRPVAIAQTPSSAGCTLTSAPIAVTPPTTAGPIHPPPRRREAEEEERLHLAELDRVQERPVERRHDHDQPADVAPDRQQGHAGEEARGHGHAPQAGGRSPEESHGTRATAKNGG